MIFSFFKYIMYFRSAPEVCPLKDGNILNVKLFTKDDIACRSPIFCRGATQIYNFVRFSFRPSIRK